METLRKNIRLFLLLFLISANVFVWFRASLEEGRGYLTVAFLDIGQGDGIYIEAPNGNQMIIDGGPSAKILEELGTVMPFYDHSVDILMVSNPDKDHIAGFMDILNTMEVSRVIEPGTKSDSHIYAELEKAIENENATKIIARRGMHIKLDEKTDFEVLFPDRDVSNFKTNDGSILGKLTYGDTCFIFTGDAPALDERYLVGLDGLNLDCEVLKVGHHGSRTSTAEEFVAAVSPEVAVISDGKNNKYGHPHKETLDTLEKYGVSVYRTDLMGTIIMKSDGKKIEIQTKYH